MHFTTALAAAVLLPFVFAAPLEQRACTGPAVNTATLDLIKEFEGFRASPYSDPTGNPTVGYGHLCSNSACSDVPYSFPLTETTGTQLLASDVKVCLAMHRGRVFLLTLFRLLKMPSRWQQRPASFSTPINTARSYHGLSMLVPGT